MWHFWGQLEPGHRDVARVIYISVSGKKFERDFISWLEVTPVIKSSADIPVSYRAEGQTRTWLFLGLFSVNLLWFEQIRKEGFPALTSKGVSLIVGILKIEGKGMENPSLERKSLDERVSWGWISIPGYEYGQQKPWNLRWWIQGFSAGSAKLLQLLWRVKALSREHTGAVFWEFWWHYEHTAIYICSIAALLCSVWGLFRLFNKCQKRRIWNTNIKQRQTFKIQGWSLRKRRTVGRGTVPRN